VTNDDEITEVFRQISARYNGKIHTLVHSVAFAPAEDLKNDFLLTSREGFRIAHDISVYSLIALSRAAEPLMSEGGSIITLTYLGAEKVMQGYNVMGVAKAALEATVRYLSASLGQIRTLAARGIGSLGDFLKVVSERAPLKRNVDPAEVATTAAFLAGDGASGITGEVIHVDCGYNVMGY